MKLKDVLQELKKYDIEIETNVIGFEKKKDMFLFIVEENVVNIDSEIPLKTKKKYVEKIKK